MADTKKKGATVDTDLIRTLASLLEETGLGEIEYGTDDWHIRIAAPSTTIAAPAPAAAAPMPAAPGAAPSGGGAEAADHPGTVRSPMVGVVYTASDPDTPSFVSVGDTVAAGDTLLLIEAMKVFNPITAPKAGTVSRILVSNGDPVEFGEPLVVIE